MSANKKRALGYVLLAAGVGVVLLAGGWLMTLHEPKRLVTLQQPEPLHPWVRFLLTTLIGGRGAADSSAIQIRNFLGGRIVDVSFSPDGKRLAMAGFTESNRFALKVLDSSTGYPLHTLTTGYLFDGKVSFSADGTQLICPGSVSDRVAVFEISTGRELRALIARADWSYGRWVDFAMSRDGKRLATAYGPVKVWDVVSGEELLTLKQKETNCLSVAINSDGSLVAAASQSGIILWNGRTGEELSTLEGSSAYHFIESMEFTADEKRLVAVEGFSVRSAGVLMWDIPSGKRRLPALKGYDGSGRSSSLALSPDGKQIALESQGKIKIWDIETGEVALTLSGYGARVKRLRFSPDGTRLAAVAFGDRGADIWDVSTRTSKK